MIFAQLDAPSEGLASGYFSPLILAAVVYVILFAAARVLDGRDDPRAETAEDIGFALMLLSGAYVVILAVVAAVSEAEMIWDLVRIVLVVAAFFAILILALLFVFERGIGGLSRLRRRTKAD